MTRKQENLTFAIEDSIFRWSSFDPRFNVLPEEPHDLLGYEYKTPKEADTRIKMEDGEIAWDLGHSNYPGPPMRKMLFGIYGKDTFIADEWDANRPDLVGAATIKDWEWCEYTGEYYEGEEDPFTAEAVLARLNEEISFLQACSVTKTKKKQ